MKKYLSLLVYGLMMACSTQEAKTDKEYAPMEMLIGTYTGQGSEGIYRVSFNPNDGSLGVPQLVAAMDNPSFLAKSNDGKYIVAVSEGLEGSISSFRQDETDNELALITTMSTQGKHPCYTDINNQNNLVAFANYSSGNVGLIGLAENGRLSGNTMMAHHHGNGPNEERQEGPHAHCSVFEGDNLYAVDLGIDQVIKYSTSGDSITASEVVLELEPGDGPRHLIFHPSEPLAFLINELSNTVVSLRALSDGSLETISRLSTLPSDFNEHSQAADIHLSQDGKFLYVTNRGHNSVSIFRVADDGQLKMVDITSTNGDWPRNFAITPDNRFLLVANQNSNNIIVFKRDESTGKLQDIKQSLAISQPVCLLF